MMMGGRSYPRVMLETLRHKRVDGELMLIEHDGVGRRVSRVGGGSDIGMMTEQAAGSCRMEDQIGSGRGVVV